jgi:aspartate/glutamate racemase
VVELGLFDEPIVGILGGMGPSATAVFYEHLIAMTDASCDQEPLHVVIDSFSQIPDRTDFLLGDRSLRVIAVLQAKTKGAPSLGAG